MKNRIILIALLLSLLLLTGCTSPARLLQNAVVTLQPGSQGQLPDPIDPAPREDSRPAALYFRMEGEAYLATEYRMIQRTSNFTYETALVQALLAGPSGQSLSPLFPEGTRLLATAVQGRTLFVTFSKELLHAYADEPVDWQEYDYWARESPLRRRLCMQSLAATITENCDIDSIQVLVEQDAANSGTLRLKQNYYLDDSMDSVLAQPLTRSSQYLLTPEISLSRILTLQSAHDWERLYDSVEQTDPQTGLVKPNYNDFVTQMSDLPDIASYSISAFGLSQDGLDATFAVQARITLPGPITVSSQTRVIRLHRVSGLWQIPMSQLTGWLEEERK